MKICLRCKTEFDPKLSKYLCGYGKCSKCCGDCMHRNYPNPDYDANAVNKKVLDNFFSKL